MIYRQIYHSWILYCEFYHRVQMKNPTLNDNKRLLSDVKWTSISQIYKTFVIRHNFCFLFLFLLVFYACFKNFIQINVNKYYYSILKTCNIFKDECYLWTNMFNCDVLNILQFLFVELVKKNKMFVVGLTNSYNMTIL